MPLPSDLQREFEGLLGSSLEGIRIHADAAAAELAASERASAFTVGRDIVFGDGRFAPGTQRGRTLLAHELAHTVQQRARGIHAAPAVAEAEARTAGRAAASGRPGRVQSAAPVSVQKDDDDDIKKKKKKQQQQKKKPTPKPKGKTAKSKKASKAKPWSDKRAKASTAATASKRAKTMGSMTPEQQRQVEVLDQFGERAEHAGKDRAQHFRKEEKGRTRTEKSEKQRHVDPMKRVSGHHGFPQYLGGEFEQTLIDLGEDLHYLYHQELDLVEGIPRKLGSNYYKNLKPAERDALFRKLIDHAQRFDKKYSKLYPDKRTRIAAAMKRGIRQAGFKVPSAGKKAPTAKTAKKSPKPTTKTKIPKPKAKAKATTKPKAKPKPGIKPKAKAVASPPRGIKAKAAKVGKLPKVSKAPKIPRIPKVRGVRAPRIPRLRAAGRMAGRGLAAIAFMVLTAWIGAKLDHTEENIQRDIDNLGPAIQLRIEDQAWIIERLVEEDPWDPVYANVTVGLSWLKLIDPEEPPSDDYMGLKGLSVTVSHNDISKYEDGPIDAGFGYSAHVDQLTFSVPIELEPESPEESDEPAFWDQMPWETESEPEEELPPIPMRLPE